MHSLLKGAFFLEKGKVKFVKTCKGCTLEDLKGKEYKIIHKDNSKNGFLLNYSINPEVDGHLVVQPLFHAEQLFDLCEEQAKRLMELVWASCKAIHSIHFPEKIYVYSFNETEGYHLHIHIKPRLGNVQVRGACFVDWKDPKKERIKEMEKSSQGIVQIHEEKIIKRIKESEYIQRYIKKSIVRTHS